MNQKHRERTMKNISSKGLPVGHAFLKALKVKKKQTKHLFLAFSFGLFPLNLWAYETEYFMPFDSLQENHPLDVDEGDLDFPLLADQDEIDGIDSPSDQETDMGILINYYEQVADAYDALAKKHDDQANRLNQSLHRARFTLQTNKLRHPTAIRPASMQHANFKSQLCQSHMKHQGKHYRWEREKAHLFAKKAAFYREMAHVHQNIFEKKE